MSFLSSGLPNLSAFASPLGAPGKLPSFTLAGVLDEAKDKAKQLEAQGKSAYNKAADKVETSASAVASQARDAGREIQGASKGATGKPSGIVLFSPQYYAACAFGGVLACGTTHALVTPLDLVKCRRQVDKNIYKGNVDGWKKIWGTEGGLRGIYTGFSPTLIGYSVQGSFKYGFYEYFKKIYSDAAGPENAVKYKDAIYLAGSASAEFLADAAFVPFEAAKVRMQTTMPPFARGTSEALKKISAAEGTGALYRSLPSLWSRQIPYTMMKFWSFEATVTYIYANVLGKPKDTYNKAQQLGVSFVAGYIAGVFCAIVSHPADNMVSKLNAPVKPGQARPTAGQIISEVGMVGLFTNGLPIRIVMIGTLTALQWLIYDTVKVQFGLPTTGSAAPAPK